MSKKILALVLALALALVCFAGCGEEAKTPNGGDADVSGTNGKPVLKIGGIGPVTGATAVYGNAVKDGIQVAADLWNAVDTNPFTIEVNFQDDEGDQEKAVNAYNSLKDWGMDVLIGTVTTGPCLAVNEATNVDNMFQITPSASALDCAKYPNAFRVCFTDPGQGVAAAQYIANNAIASKVAVIYNSSDAYSSGISHAFVEEAAKQNIEVTTEQAFTDDNKTDFSVQLQKVQESGAELLFLPIYYQEAALIIQQAKQKGIETPIFGGDGLDGLIEQLSEDKALAENVMLLTPFVASADDEQTKTFVAAYQALGNEEVPNQFAADGYDAVLAMIECFKDNTDMLDKDASEICDFLKTKMTEISIEGLTGKITWTADGEPTKEPIVVKIVNGEYQVL